MKSKITFTQQDGVIVLANSDDTGVVSWLWTVTIGPSGSGEKPQDVQGATCVFRVSERTVVVRAKLTVCDADGNHDVSHVSLVNTLNGFMQR